MDQRGTEGQILQPEEHTLPVYAVQGPKEVVGSYGEGAFDPEWEAS